MRRTWLFGLGLIANLACSKGTIGEHAPATPSASVSPSASPSPGASPSASPSTSPSPSPSPTPGEPFVASTSGPRKLSRAELDATIRDVFGDDTAPASRVLAEDEHTPYDNDQTAQEASQALIDGLDALGEQVARRVLGDAALRRRLIPCTPTGPGDAACFRSVIASLGAKALRRPLAEDEIVEYLALQAFATESSPHYTTGFDTAVELLIQALILDPEVIWRVEVGQPTSTAGVRALDGHEIASRLSYLLWGTAPDDALIADAAAGRLASAQGRRAAAARLLADDRAKAQLFRFHAMWLGYRTLPHPANLTRAFQSETEALIDDVVFSRKADYRELFTSNRTRIDATLRAHYELPAAGQDGWTTYPAGSGRGGILSHGTVLASFSKFTDTSPTQRGILIRTRLLCQPIQPPPPTVMADEPPGEGTNACKKDRYLAHMATGSCNACHSQMDPIGFGLEAFDVAGRRRAHDEGKPECVIDGAGELPGHGLFNGPKELGERLTASGELDACAVRQWLAFALGRSLGADEEGLVTAMLAGFSGAGRSFEALMLEYVSSEAFAKKKERS